MKQEKYAQGSPYIRKELLMNLDGKGQPPPFYLNDEQLHMLQILRVEQNRVSTAVLLPLIEVLHLRKVRKVVHLSKFEKSFTLEKGLVLHKKFITGKVLDF